MSRSALTYRQAGVDIDAGDALVDRIKPFAMRTRIPEVLGDVGGFAGLCPYHLTVGAQSSMGPEPVLGNGDSVLDALQVQEQGMNILCSVSLPPVSHMVRV